MKIGVKFLLPGIIVLLSAAALLSADEGVTLENVVSPGPNRAESGSSRLRVWGTGWCLYRIGSRNYPRVRCL